MIHRRSLLLLLEALLLALQTKAQAQTYKHLFPILQRDLYSADNDARWGTSRRRRDRIRSAILLGR